MKIMAKPGLVLPEPHAGVFHSSFFLHGTFIIKKVHLLGNSSENSETGSN